jgi:hydroxyethylthiazole kinase-like uncharacterized protein yjeF
MVLSAASPLVIDADALNMLAEIPALLEKLPGNTILTPHPGEFDRLAGPSVNGYARNQKQLEFAARYGVVVILKGHSSSIAMPDGKCFYNSTGNPGMATAGSGDVLTGIILALLAQRYTPAEAALAGTYIHGLAGDIAATGTGQKALIASDIIQSLGPAFSKFEKYEKKS